MKNIMTLLFAILFSAGMAFAQSHEAVTTQDGENLEATIMQVGGSANKAFQVQYGLNNVLGIDQSGSGNLAVQNQDSRKTGSYDPDNEAFINQSGNWNTAYQTQEASSQRNSMNIDQSGNTNWAQQVQKKDGPGHAQGYAAVIDQSGNQNWASQLQEGNAISATIDQVGSFNWAYQHQDGNRNKAEVDQSGNQNTATQLQYGSQSHPLNGELIIIQSGNGNTAYQYQDNTETGSYGIITQEGSWNYATQNQFGPGSNTASISQYSNSNVAVQNQTGVDNTATIVQD